MDLQTTYLGMELANPLVPSSSPLSRSLDMARRLEDAGAPALVMHSLFEESIDQATQGLGTEPLHQGLGHAEASSYLPGHNIHLDETEHYIEQLQRLKSALQIPVIASLNGIHFSTWIDHGKELQQAGADALELNVYYVTADVDTTSREVEQRYIDLLTELRSQVDIPIAMKLSPQFSSPGNMVKRLEQAGANGVSLFNRFYQPDIDIHSLQIAPQIHLSSSSEALLAMRWIAILYGRVEITLAATGGAHSAEDIIKLLLAGADVVHVCGALLKHGPEYLATLLKGIEEWLDESPFDSLEQIRGNLSQQHCNDPEAYVRSNYLATLRSYSPGFK
jgi:dihydroorotate dehydrogenase (fumarate)